MKAYDFHGKRNICGDRIREARLRARLSQSDLCRVCNWLVSLWSGT